MNTGATYNIPEELKDIIPAYLERRKEDSAQLNDLMAKKDFAGIMRIAHKLKGNGASFGFDHITELGDRMNDAAKSKTAKKLKKLYRNLKTRFSRSSLIWTLEFSQ